MSDYTFTTISGFCSECNCQPCACPKAWVCPVCSRGVAPGIVVCPCMPCLPRGDASTTIRLIGDEPGGGE